MTDDAGVAIVAGAGGELGRATAVTLAARGFTVVGVDRSEAGLNELPDGIGREVAEAPTPRRHARSFRPSPLSPGRPPSW